MNVSFLSTDSQGKDKEKESEPEDHYYKPKNYKKLSQHQFLAEMHEAQGNPKPNKHTKEVKKLAKKVTALAISVQATQSEYTVTDGEESMSDSSNDSLTMDDQKHPAMKARKNIPL